MTDEELITQFESGSLPAVGFHHADHVRVAFAYLGRYPLLQAVEKLSAALRCFAASQGKPTDLLTWKDGVLKRYYAEETLQSDLAKRVFVLPDRRS